MNNDEPVVIGGFPGSGTRVVAIIIQDFGVFMGNNQNVANDALDFMDFYNNWIDLFLQENLDEQDKEMMVKEFQTCVKKHLFSLSDKNSKWGFKNPRSFLLLPFIHSFFPRMKFIHVVRDGRDIAYSKKTLPNMKKHSVSMLGKVFENPFDRLELWSIFSMMHVKYCTNKMKNSYMMIRYEDLCTNPEESILRISDFIQQPIKDIEMMKGRINPSKETIGRWKKRGLKNDDISQNAKSALKCFGYF